MSGTTIRKLRQISIGKDTGYFLLPPRNWLDTVEKSERKKILAFTVKSVGESLILTPTFKEPAAVAPSNSSPEKVGQMLRQGTLTVKLREIPKGRNVYRVVKVPRSWVRARERERYRKVVALNITPEPTCITVMPVFGEKLKQVN